MFHFFLPSLDNELLKTKSVFLKLYQCAPYRIQYLMTSPKIFKLQTGSIRLSCLLSFQQKPCIRKFSQLTILQTHKLVYDLSFLPSVFIGCMPCLYLPDGLFTPYRPHFRSSSAWLPLEMKLRLSS